MPSTTRQILLNGTTANDGTGDTLRAAADKINGNFETLYRVLGDSDAATGKFHLDSDGHIIFGDSDVGSYTTTLVGDVATSSNKTITLPDATGTVVLKTTTDTLTNKTLTTPKVGMIHDSNGNQVLELNGITSSTHFLCLSSGDSATAVKFSVDSDTASGKTNVDVRIAPLNEGSLYVDAPIVQNSETLATSGAADPWVPVTYINSTGTTTITCSDGTVTGQTKKFVNISTGYSTITPANLGVGTSLILRGKRGVEMLWHNTAGEWMVMGLDSDDNLKIVP